MSNYGVGLRNGVAFALGTIPSLTSGGALRPSLLLDFFSGSLDSRITFSRGTQAMQYGSDGTLQYAPNNLLTYSNQADNAAWTKSNSFVQQNLLLYSEDFTNANWALVNVAAPTSNTTIAPDGTLTADTVTASAGAAVHNINQNTAVSSSPVTFSVYVKAGTHGFLQIYHGANSAYYANFNLSTGVLGTVGGSASATITAAANGFYRCTLTITPSAASAFRIAFISSSTAVYNESWTAAGTETFYAWGAQLVQGSVPGDYRATTTAALPVLYADYNGALRARKLCEDSANALHYIAPSSIAGGFSAGQVYTYSVYAKAGERSRLYMDGRRKDGTFFTIIADLTTGNISTATNVISSGTQNLGNGWWRVYFTTNIQSGAFVESWAIAVDNGIYAGNGSSGIYIVDAQLTPGYLPLAVTETTSAAVYGPRFDYDPSSLVRQNLLTYSQDLSTYWNYGTGVTLNPSAITAPDGTLTARTVNYASGGALEFLRNNTTAISTVVAQTVSFWAKSISGNTSFSADLQNIESTTVTLTSEWQRFTWTVTPAAARTWIDFQLGAAGTVALWGVQLNQGSTALPYTATTTAPYTLTTARGLLIEEQRVNLFTYSNDFTNVIWSNANVTVTPASTTSPEGVLNMSKLAATAGAATSLYQSAIVAATSASGSIYVKQGTGATTANAFVLRNVTTALDLVGGTLNYSTGVWTYSTGSTGVVVRNIGNGIWRVEISASAGITAGDTIRLYTGFAGGAATAGDFLYAYGAQLEAGAFATSYIPTVASTATRNADSASITTLTPWYNATEGSLFVQFSCPGYDSTLFPPIVQIGISGVSNRGYSHVINASVNTSAFNIYDDTPTYQGTASSVAYTKGTTRKQIGAYKVNDSAGTSDGVAAVTDTTVTLPTSLNVLAIGQYVVAGTVRLNGHIQIIKYYSTRLPNASLQSITA